MSDFEGAVNYVLRNEGGFNKTADDAGGTTNYGISLRFLREIPPERLKKYAIYEDVSDTTIETLTMEQAKLIYQGEFWYHAPFDKIVNQAHCNYIFDMAVNMGIGHAIKCVQRACWAVMKRWDLLPDDGVMGAKTLSAIQQSGFLIMPALRAERAAYYRAIIEQTPSQKKFLSGWLNRTYNMP